MHRILHIRTDNSIHVTALVKGDERYIFLFDSAHVSQTLHTLGRFADDADLSFTWYDAAKLSRAVRQAARSRTR